MHHKEKSRSKPDSRDEGGGRDMLSARADAGADNTLSLLSANAPESSPDIRLIQALVWQSAPSAVVMTGGSPGGLLLAVASFMSVCRRSRTFRRRCAAADRDPDDWLVIGACRESISLIREAIDDFHLTRNVAVFQADPTDPHAWLTIRQVLGTMDGVSAVLASLPECHREEALVGASSVVSSGQFVVVVDGSPTIDASDMEQGEAAANEGLKFTEPDVPSEEARIERFFRIEESRQPPKHPSGPRETVLWRI